jgi:Zn-dependent alcohol dehydrogenase
MRDMRVVLSVAALANYAITVWHAYLAEKVNPALPVEEAVRIAAIAGVLTLAGVALLWTRRQRIGSLVLIGVFVVGLAIGSAEHLFVAGPNNVFDVGNGDWAMPFKISVWILLFLEVAGLSAAGRVLAARS